MSGHQELTRLLSTVSRTTFITDQCPTQSPPSTLVDENSAGHHSCDFNPINTIILNDFPEVLLTVITFFLKMSLSDGVSPLVFNNTSVKPPVKKVSLPKEDIQYFCAFSNLSFTLKIIKKVVATRIKNCIQGIDARSPIWAA